MAECLFILSRLPILLFIYLIFIINFLYDLS